MPNKDAHKPPAADGTPLRALGATEDMYYRFDSVCPLYFGVISRFNGPLEVNALRAAWDAVRARHPLLRARIVPGPQDVPWFVSSEADMSLEIRRAAPEEAWRVLEGSLIRRFDIETGPLVRCVVLEHGPNDFSLVTTYHHAISDGRSATFVMRDLLTSLGQMARGEAPDLEPLPLMDYYGDRIHTLQSYETWEQFTETVSKTWNAAWRFIGRVGLPKGILRTKQVPLSEQTLLIEPRSVDPDVMRAVLRRAKSEGVTVQCVLNAALSMAVAEDRPARGLRATACTQVLDVRDRLIPPVGEDCGLFATGNTSMHRIRRKTDFWKLTHEIRRGLQEALETPLPFFHPAIHKSYAGIARRIGQDRAQAFSEVLSKIHPEGLAVSNLGRVKIEAPDSPLTMTSFAFATNTNVLNSFNTSAASCNGRLMWSFSASSIVGRDKLVEVADRSVALMLQAAADAPG